MNKQYIKMLTKILLIHLEKRINLGGLQVLEMVYELYQNVASYASFYLNLCLEIKIFERERERGRERKGEGGESMQNKGILFFRSLQRDIHSK